MPPLISDAYLHEQVLLHTNHEYGVASLFFAPFVTQLIDEHGITDLLDYGAGKQRLRTAIKPKCMPTYRAYDPCVAAIAERPSPAELVVCIDVLEHVEPECLDAVLDDLRDLTLRLGFITIHTGPARKVLSDGRNAHLIQQPLSWWMPQIASRFYVLNTTTAPSGFVCCVASIERAEQ